MEAQLIHEFNGYKYFSNNTITTPNFEVIQFKNLFNNLIPVGEIMYIKHGVIEYIGDITRDNNLFNEILLDLNYDENTYPKNKLSKVTYYYISCYKVYDDDDDKVYYYTNDDILYKIIDDKNHNVIKRYIFGIEYNNDEKILQKVKKYENINNVFNVEFNDNIFAIYTIKYIELNDKETADDINKISTNFINTLTCKLRKFKININFRNLVDINVFSNTFLNDSIFVKTLYITECFNNFIKKIKDKDKDDNDNLKNNDVYNFRFLEYALILATNVSEIDYNYMVFKNAYVQYKNGEIFEGIICIINLEKIILIKGCLIHNNGDVHIGSFVNNKLAHQGKIIYNNGYVYNGYVFNGEPHFYGALKEFNGKTFFGEFNKSKPIYENGVIID